MNKFLAFITFLLFLLLLWFSNNKYQACCNNNNVIKKVPSVIVSEDSNNVTETPITKIENDEDTKTSPPLFYKWNSNEALTSEGWEAKKGEIISGKSDSNILQIIAPYFKEEGEKTGIARAKNVFVKLGGKSTLKNTEFKAKLLEFYEGAKTTQFEGTDFNWLVRNDNIQEVDNKALIYFPTSSSEKLKNENIINYLNNVATSLKNNDKTVTLSGHADNSGNAVRNDKLALSRANAIKAELVRLGVDASRITTISHGEAKPIASNSTRAGRQKNRRVELEIK